VSVSGANSYIEGYGIDFGFRTNDSDNVEGANLIANSDLFSGVPWIALINARTMEFVEHDADSWSFDIEARARDLAE